MEQFYTIEEVAEALKVTRAAIYKWMKEGKLEYVSVGSDRRIPQSALDTFLGRKKEDNTKGVPLAA